MEWRRLFDVFCGALSCLFSRVLWSRVRLHSIAVEWFASEFVVISFNPKKPR